MDILFLSGEEAIKNDIRDVCSTADLVLVFLVHLVHWYLLGVFNVLDVFDVLDLLDLAKVCSEKISLIELHCRNG